MSATLKELGEKAARALETRDFGAALQIGRVMEKEAPMAPETWQVLGQAALGFGDYTEAAKYFTALHERFPGDAKYRHQLTEIYRAVGYFEDAVKMYRPVFEKSPDVLEKYTYFGQLCALGGAEEEALTCFQRALEISPDNPDILAALAGVAINLGRFDEAKSHVDQALKVNPEHLPALVFKVSTHKTLKPEELKILASVAADQGAHPGSRVDAGFALGRALANAKKYDKAFNAYQAANEGAAKLFEGQGFRFDVDEERALFEANKKLFQPAFLKKFEGAGALSPNPVFIIGLPRSGTTLVERLLAAHPKITAGGELKLLGEFPIRVEHLAAANPGVSKETILQQMAPAWRAEYQHLLKTHGADAEYVTDKMPLNFPYVGLAACLFPKAKFIFLEREPMDNCLSMYFQALAGSYAATTSLESLGAFYQLFQDYLAYWRENKALQIYNLSYENLAKDTEKEAKKLIDFLSVPWDEAVLDFHRAGGAIRTLSAGQVREPVSAKYIGQWKNYEDFLAPLRKALGVK